MRTKRCWPVVILLAASALSVRAADPPVLDLEKSHQVTAMMDAAPRLATVFAMCPADAFKQDAPFYSLYFKPQAASEAQCGADPVACYRRCVDDGVSGSCFGLARVFQLHPRDVESRYAQTLFAMACDAGMGAGCTNRASSLRNNPVGGEPMSSLPKKAQSACEHRSFSIACQQGDSWGCAMLGQSYENGEGVIRDAGRARQYYRTSCDLAPDFASCSFAKASLAGMDKPAP